VELVSLEAEEAGAVAGALGAAGGATGVVADGPTGLGFDGVSFVEAVCARSDAPAKTTVEKTSAENARMGRFDTKSRRKF